MEELKSIDLGEWTKVGEGGNGTVYAHPTRPDVILKVNRARLNTRSIIEHEYKTACAVESMGLPTPRMLEIVRVGDLYGVVSERIREKKSLSRICNDTPDRTEEMARVLCAEGKKLFATPCPAEGLFPSRKEQLISVIDKVSFLRRKDKERVLAFARTIPDNGHCLHGDFQMGNLISSEGKYYWIDLDRFAHGDPMFDIGHLFMICQIYAPMKRVQELFHMSQDQFRRFWDAFASAYTGKEDHAEFDALAGKFALADLIVRCHYDRPNFSENIFFRITARRILNRFWS